MSAPKIAVIGSTGYVASFVLPTFIEALKARKLKELMILSTEAKLNHEKIVSYKNGGAKIVPINYSDVASLTAAFKGADVVLSFLGTTEVMIPTWARVLEAITASGVKIYFPSEYENDLFKGPVSKCSHRLWDLKRDHFLQAKKRGLVTVRMAVGPIMEDILQPDIGLDCAAKKWRVAEGALDLLMSMTAEIDIARFTLEAALLAYKDPQNVPDIFEVTSDTKTLRQYKAVLDKISGVPINVEEVSLEGLRKDYEKTGNILTLFMIMFGEEAYDMSKSNANEILNPNESLWKLTKFEDYAKEWKGVPIPHPIGAI